MRYYLFSDCYPNDSLSVIGRESSGEHDRYDASECKVLSESYLKHFDFNIGQNGREYDLLANSMGWYLVSSGIKSAISEACSPDEIQFLPFPSFEIISNIKIRQSYDLMNVLRGLDCVDLEGSSLDFDYNDIGVKYISAVHELRLETNGIPREYNIFRLENLRTYTIVSEKVVRAINKSMPVACSFTLLR